MWYVRIRDVCKIVGNTYNITRMGKVFDFFILFISILFCRMVGFCWIWFSLDSDFCEYEEVDNEWYDKSIKRI